MGMIISIIVVLAAVAFLCVRNAKAKGCDLFKWIGIAILLAFLLSWIIPYGYFSAGSFYEYGMKRIGLSEISTVMYYSIYFCLTTILYFFVIGGFYGVVSRTEGYNQLVAKLAKVVEKHKMVSAIVIASLMIVLTSVLSNSLALVLFVPFIINVLSKAKFDKLSTMALTFGAILAGEVAASFGTEGLTWFNSYVGTDLSTGRLSRLIFAGCALLLYVALLVFKVKKLNLKKTHKEEVEDYFETVSPKSKTKVWPTIVIFSVLFVVVFMGFFNWENIFGITCFTEFHTWLTGLTIGDFEIVSSVLGSSAVALGAFEVSSIIPIIIIVSILVAVMNRVKFNEYLDNFGDGFARMFKPVCLYTLVYALFIVSYLSPFMAYISDWAFGLTKKFNPFITIILGFVTSIFHADLGYTGYIVGTYLTYNFTDTLDIAHTIYVATFGICQIFIPTSGLLLLGLSYLKIDYKSWFKYIWMFVAAVAIVLVLIATIFTYAV